MLRFDSNNGENGEWNEVVLTNFNSKEGFVRENKFKHLNSWPFYNKINNIKQIIESSWLKVYYCPKETHSFRW